MAASLIPDAHDDVVKVESSSAESSEEPEELAEAPDELWCKRTHWCCPECGQDRVSDIIGPQWSLRDLRDRIHSDPTSVRARHRRGPWCHARLQHGGHISCLMKIHTTLIMSLTDATQQLLGRADHATVTARAPKLQDEEENKKKKPKLKEEEELQDSEEELQLGLAQLLGGDV
jgi:hypothetical protein